MLYPLSYEGREGQGSAPVLGGRTGIASRPRLNRAGLWLLSSHGRARFGHVVARDSRRLLVASSTACPT
jgi:hypothetical protein